MILTALSNTCRRFRAPGLIHRMTAITLAALLSLLGVAKIGNAEEETNAPRPENHLLKYGHFTHIPGPNLILQPVEEGWDSVDIETGGMPSRTWVSTTCITTARASCAS